MSLSNSAICVRIMPEQEEGMEIYEIQDLSKANERKLVNHLENGLVNQSLKAISIKFQESTYNYEFSYKCDNFHIDYASEIARKITKQIFSDCTIEDKEDREETLKVFSTVSKFARMLSDKLNGISSLDTPVESDDVDSTKQTEFEPDEVDIHSESITSDDLDTENLQTNLLVEEKNKFSNSYINDNEKKFGEKIKPFKETLYSQEVTNFMNGIN